MNRDACRLAGLDEPMVFHRSAGPATPRVEPMMWAGDQLVTFDDTVSACCVRVIASHDGETRA